MNTVSGRTSLLVANDPTFSSGKTRNAAKQGVPIVDQAAFTRLLNDVTAAAAKPETLPPPPPLAARVEPPAAARRARAPMVVMGSMPVPVALPPR